MYRAPSPSPYGPPSPVPPVQGLPSPMSPGGQIQPGTITYTTSTSPDGKLIYHPFKAVPVSYQTNTGIVSGIQWIPAEATSVLPLNATPANSDFMSSWNRGGLNRDEKALREWQKDEEHRIRKEEKEATKRIKKEKERELRQLRDRGMSGGGYPGSPGTMPSPYGGGGYTNPISDLERRMDSVDIGGRKSGDFSNKRRSTYTEAPVTYPVGVGARPPSPYLGSMAPPSPIATASNPGYAPAAGYPIPNHPPNGPGQDPYQRAASPYHGGPPGYPPEPAILSRSRAPSPIPGMPPYGSRSRAPSPIPGVVPPYGARPRSRAASPLPGGYPPAPRSRAASPLPGTSPLPYTGQPGFYGMPRSPHVGGSALLGGSDQPLLAPPDGFSRPANLAQSYTFFDTMKIQDMDDFYDNMPKMPMVLVPHDVYHEDWIRFIQDLALSWVGKLPTSDPNRSSKPSAVGAELIDLWNNSFFHPRGVEVVLYKGHERRSGQGYGHIDRHLPGFGDGSDSDSSGSLDSSSSSAHSDDKYGRGAAGGGYYGSYAADSRRRKAERKAEKKRKHREKKARRRARERERTYALYITCITPRDGALGPPF